MVAAGVLLAAGLIAVYVLDLNPQRGQQLTSFPAPETALEAESRVGLLEQRLRDAGHKLSAPLSQLLSNSAGQDRLFAEASGIEKSGGYVLAAEMYNRLARSGHGKSARRLGEIYERGNPGVARDYLESQQWYETARQLGETVEGTCARRC